MIATSAHQIMVAPGKPGKVRSVCYVVEAGATMRRIAVPRAAEASTLTAATATLAFVSCSSRSQLAAHSGFTYEQNELFERKECGARDAAPSEWSEDIEWGLGRSPNDFLLKFQRKTMVLAFGIAVGSGGPNLHSSLHARGTVFIELRLAGKR